MVFDIQRSGEWLILETEEYPRLRIFVNFMDTVPKLGKVELLEFCSPADMIQTIEELNFCLQEYRLLLYN